MKKILTWALLAGLGLSACSDDPPPPSVDDFVNDSVLLDATMVRCSADRARTKYEPECVNAREAINRVARAEEAARRADLEAQSERKRQALRRTQQAAEAARRRAEEAARRREEAAYLAQFDPLPPEGAAPNSSTGSVPNDAPTSLPATGSTTTGETDAESLGGPEPSSGLNDIREELQRRQEDNPR